MKPVYSLQKIFLFLIMSFNISTYAQTVYYVGNGGDWHNWDIYSFDISTSIETRLTTHSAIDNHPVISHADPSRIVWSANRDNDDFDIYVGDVSDMDGTAVRLTFDSYPGNPGQGVYADRHPHWHPNGQLIIFTSKNQYFEFLDIPTTTCSQPVVKQKYYEKLNVIELTPPGNAVASYTELDIVSAWDQINNPGIWVNTPDTYVGHPSFNHIGDQVVFTAAIDGEGKNWEVYVAGFDPVGIGLIPNSLRRVTFGPNNIDNPIKMSGGATFSNDDSQILFNSTRLTNGNSQIYAVPSGAIDIPVHFATQLTFHPGNDYVPEPIPGGNAFIVTSDLGPARLCTDCTTAPGPTTDLDVVLIDGGTRTILGTDIHQETLLLADEVSWFCGLKPNLSSCTFLPRIMDVESLWLEAHPHDLMLPDILNGYGPAYNSNGPDLYANGWGNLEFALSLLAPDILANIYSDMNDLWLSEPPLPLWAADPASLDNWLSSTQALRKKKYVVPVEMFEMGLTGTSSISSHLNSISIPSGCIFYHDDLQNLHTSAPPSGFYSGDPPGGFFIVEPGGSAFLTAGCKIIFEPGTVIESGGFLSAEIVPAPPSSSFCFSPEVVSQPQNLARVDNFPVNYSNTQLRFKIYSNPASGSFWVELLDDEDPCMVKIEVYSFSGHRLLHDNRHMVKRTQISIPNHSSGLYLVKLTKGSLTGSQTLVLNNMDKN